jgi:hypothetical protein
MGPEMLPREAANGLEWDQWCSRKNLPVVLNGPSVDFE